MLVRRIEIKDKDAVFFHKKGGLGNSPLKPVNRADVVERIKG